MGHLQNKYTREYFLKKDSEGNILPYGVEGIESFLNGELREHDKEILSRIDFSGGSVLEFGFGRGETIKYAMEQGAARYIGIDFSDSACQIAREFLEKFSITGPQIICADAIDFVRQLANKIEDVHTKHFNIVLMLDFVEHVPRTELQELLQLLKPLLDPNALIIVNTPDFLFDNDVLAEGLKHEGMDSSDMIEETQGMHCNRYTLESLRNFFTLLGYEPISQGHYFAIQHKTTNVWDSLLSYRQTWEEAKLRGVPLLGDWKAETFEYAYPINNIAEIHRFTQGGLDGIAIYVTPQYLEYYNFGNYDASMMQYLSKFNLAGKTIFDLGAFVGVNSLQFSKLLGDDGVVCAFEPNPYNVDRFRLNLSENPEFGKKVKVYQFALSNEQGTCHFKAHRNIDDGISSASHLQGAHTTMPEESLSELGFIDVDVKSTTLDDFVSQTGLRPDCIKIDIEGSEHLALSGSLETLEKYRPILLIELHSVFCAIAVLKIIFPLGYIIELLRLEPDGRCIIGAYAANATDIIDSQSPDVSELDAKIELWKMDLVASTLRLDISTTNFSFDSVPHPLSTDMVQRLTRLLMGYHKVLTTLVSQQDEIIKDMTSEIVKDMTSEINKKIQEIDHLHIKEIEAQKEIEELQCANDSLSLEKDSLTLEIDKQRQTNESLSESLLRYQRFPLIRFARKVRRLFA